MLILQNRVETTQRTLRTRSYNRNLIKAVVNLTILIVGFDNPRFPSWRDLMESKGVKYSQGLDSASSCVVPSLCLL